MFSASLITSMFPFVKSSSSSSGSISAAIRMKCSLLVMAENGTEGQP